MPLFSLKPLKEDLLVNQDRLMIKEMGMMIKIIMMIMKIIAIAKSHANLRETANHAFMIAMFLASVLVMTYSALA